MANEAYEMFSGVKRAWRKSQEDADARDAVMAYADSALGLPAEPVPTGLAALGRTIGINPDGVAAKGLASLGNLINPQDQAPALRSAPSAAAPQQSPNLGRAASAISGIESGGRYDALGPVTKTGDRALGKYQIMAANIPQWSQEVLGRPVTAQEFLTNPQLQDQIFQGKFGQYVQKYGPEGAARAWFAGEGGMNDPNRKDQLGTSVANYGQKFAQAYGPGATDAGGPAQAAISQTAPPQGLAALGGQSPGTPPQQMAQAAPAQAQQPRFSPEQAAAIRGLLKNPQTRAIGMGLMSGNKLQYQTGADGEIIALDPTGRQPPQVVYKAAVKPMVVAADSGIYDPATKSFIQSPSSANTPDQKNFEAAKREGYTGSFNDWLTNIKKAGATNVNLPSAEKSYDTELGKADAKTMVDLQEQGRNASKAINTLSVMGKITDNPDFYSGTGAQALTTMRKMAGALGLANADKAAPNELFQSLSNRVTLDGLGGSLGTAISNGDRDFIQQTQANLSNTPAGNKSVITMNLAVEKRKQQVAQLAREYAKNNKGRLDGGFEQVLADYAEKNPMFPPLPKQAAPASKTKSGVTWSVE